MKKKNTEKNRQTYMQTRLRCEQITTKSGKRYVIDNYAETVNVLVTLKAKKRPPVKAA